MLATLLKPRPHYLLKELIRNSAINEKLHVLQIGANDGIYVDPLHALLLRHSTICATRVEPIAEYFKRLQKHCSCPQLRNRVRCVQAAICANDGTACMVLPNPMKSLGTFRQGIAHFKQTEIQHSGEISDWLEESVPAMSPETLLRQSMHHVVDIHISDCEGYDIELACLMPFNKMATRLVYLEIHSSPNTSSSDLAKLGCQLGRLWSLLGGQGFNQIVWDGFNFIAWKSPPAATSRRPRLIPAALTLPPHG